MEPSFITVRRTSKQDVGERHVVVSVDGRKLADLLYGQRLTRELEPGHHRLKVHNTLVWKTLEFDLAPGEHIHFTTANRLGSGAWQLLMLIGAGPLYVTLERDSLPPQA
jgi:hypothetical protein